MEEKLVSANLHLEEVDQGAQQAETKSLLQTAQGAPMNENSNNCHVDQLESPSTSYNHNSTLDKVKQEPTMDEAINETQDERVMLCDSNHDTKEETARSDDEDDLKSPTDSHFSEDRSPDIDGLRSKSPQAKRKIDKPVKETEINGTGADNVKSTTRSNEISHGNEEPSLLGRNRRVRQKNRYFLDFHCLDLTKGTRSPKVEEEVSELFESIYCPTCQTRTAHDIGGGCQCCAYKKIVESSRKRKDAPSKSKGSHNSTSKRSKKSGKSSKNKKTKTTQRADHQVHLKSTIPSTTTTTTTSRSSRITGDTTLKIVLHTTEERHLVKDHQSNQHDTGSSHSSSGASTSSNCSVTNGLEPNKTVDDTKDNQSIISDDSTLATKKESALVSEKAGLQHGHERNDLADKQQQQQHTNHRESPRVNARIAPVIITNEVANNVVRLQPLPVAATMIANDPSQDLKSSIITNSETTNTTSATSTCASAFAVDGDTQSRHDNNGICDKLPRLDSWTPEEVSDYILSKGFSNEAELFKTQLVDGISLLLMQRSDFTYGLKMKLGPALKIYDQVCKLKREYFRTVSISGQMNGPTIKQQ